MTEQERLDRIRTDFPRLSESNQSYVVAVQQALLFAQKMTQPAPPKNKSPSEPQAR